MNILYKYTCDETKESLFNNRLDTALEFNKQDIRHFLRSDMYNFNFDFNPFWWDVDLIALIISIKLNKQNNNNIYLECDSITERYFDELGISNLFDKINSSTTEYSLYTPGIPDLGEHISKIHTSGFDRKWRGLRIWQSNDIYIKQRLKDLHKAVNDVLDYAETNDLVSKQFFKDLFLNNNALVKQGVYTPFRKDKLRNIVVLRETLQDESTVLHLCPTDKYVNLVTKEVSNKLENLGVFNYFQHELWGLIQDDDYAKNIPNTNKYPDAFKFTSNKCVKGEEPYGTNINLTDPWIAARTILHNYTLPKHEYLNATY